MPPAEPRDSFLNPDFGQRNINCDPALRGFDGIVFRAESKGRTGYSSIRLVGEELVYDDADKPALEYYFGALLAHISAQG